MFQQGIDAKEFGEKLLETVMYSSLVSAEHGRVQISMNQVSMNQDGGHDELN